MPQEKVKQEKPKKKKLSQPIPPKWEDYDDPLKYDSALKKYKEDLKKWRATRTITIDDAEKKMEEAKVEPKPAPKKPVKKEGEESLTAQLDKLIMNRPTRKPGESFPDYIKRQKEHQKQVKELRAKIKK
jgi:hypothetical protein